MNIVLIGYGRMGKEIHQTALERGHEIIKIIDYSNRYELTDLQNLNETVDVAIEFTQPSEARINVSNCLRMGIPVVSGTTGWNKELEGIKALSHELRIGFLQASNFSIGMNITFALNKYLAKIMNSHPSYRANITEIHHTQKLDKPSGTAITLADQMLMNLDAVYDWALDHKADGVLAIKAIREENTPGIHKIKYQSAFDEIELSHTARSRKGFAIGAVIAAEFLKGQTGVYEMQDVMENLVKQSFTQV